MENPIKDIKVFFRQLTSHMIGHTDNIDDTVILVTLY